MEFEIGWKLMVALIFLGACGVAIFRTIYEDDVATDMRTINESGTADKDMV